MSFDKYKIKGAYHWNWYESDDPRNAWYKKCVDKCVEFCQGNTLDVGAGDGVVVKLLADKGIEVDGIDNEPAAIEAAETKVSGYVKLHDLNQPIKGKWEYMACLNVIEHLDDPDSILRIFKNNITKAGIIITDMPQENPSSYHTHEYTPKELADLFKDYRVVPFEIDKDFHGIEVYKP